MILFKVKHWHCNASLKQTGIGWERGNQQMNATGSRSTAGRGSAGRQNTGKEDLWTQTLAHRSWAKLGVDWTAGHDKLANERCLDFVPDLKEKEMAFD
jgi:hypothetical protein